MCVSKCGEDFVEGSHTDTIQMPFGDDLGAQVVVM